jgi:hypothetical protein
MSKKFKIASVVLSVTTALTMAGPVAHGQTTAELQAQIQALLAQITALQAQLNAQTGGGSMATSLNITRDLTVGSTGDDVKALQAWLNANGAQVAASGVGSPGNETTFFGTLTKSALSKWQAANNVSPAVGYFGPITRSKIASMGGGVPPPPSGTTPVVTPGANLQVTLGAGSPTGSAIAGAGQVNVGRFSFTAPITAGATITGLTLEKVGVLSDSNISNLYLADAATGNVVAQFQSLTNGVAIFSGLNLQVNAGQTWTGELRLDLSTSATSGNTIAWRLTSVEATGATVSGLPVTTNSLNVTSVSNPAISALTLTANAVGSTVDAGTNSVLVSSWTANVTNSAIDLKNLHFTFVGSANPGDIRNLRLMVNGQEVATRATAATDSIFNFADSPVRLGTGNSTIEIFADVSGSPNRTFTFSLLQPYRVNASDTEYDTGITASITSTNQTTITINTGSITVNLASNSPTQPVPAATSGVTLAKFTIFAAGEPVKVKFLDVNIVEAGSSAWSTLANVTDDINNIRVIDEVGGQLGNNISTVASGTSSGQCTLAATTITCHFGTSGSPVNYIVPANTTRTLSVLVDIISGTDVSTLQATLPGNTSNLEGQTSFVAASSGAATGSTLSVTSTPLTVAANSGFNTPTYIAGTQGAKIASFVVTASSAQGARISSITVDKDSDATMDLQNMKIMVGSTQFGSTRATVGDAETSLAFSGAQPIQVPAGGSVIVDVYADIQTTSTATTKTATVDIIGWSALGTISNNSITFPGAVSGQDITVSSGPTLTIAVASDTAPAKQVVMGSTGNSLASWRFTADNVDDIRVTDFTVTDTITSGTAGKASFQNLTLWDGSTQVAGPLSLTLSSASRGAAAFSLNPVIVPKNSSKTLTLRGDIATFSSGGAVSGSSHAFAFSSSTTDVTAQAVGNSAATVTISGTATGTAQSVYRTKVTLSSALLGSASNRSRVAVDDVATLSFTADAANQATLNTVVLRFSGLAVSAATSFNVDLIDSSTNALLGSAAQDSCAQSAATPTCDVTFTPAFIIDAGTTKTTKVRVNSGTFTNTANTSDSMSIIVPTASDFDFGDGTTNGIGLEATVSPFTVVNVAYE